MWIISFFVFLILQPGIKADENCDCPKRFHPVCGSDAYTYNSLCNLQCASKNNDLQLAHNGSCCPQLTCSLDRNPVCDNFGRTHQNECFLNRARCLARKVANNLLTNVHDGECLAEEKRKEDCFSICGFPGSPVCDHMGSTHDTECSLEQVNCQRRNENKSEYLLVAYDKCNLTMELLQKETSLTEEIILSPSEFVQLNYSDANDQKSISNTSDSIDALAIAIPTLKVNDFTQPCSAADCDKSWNPVCDANNKTHRNLCLFKFYACKVNRLDGSIIVLAHEGECLSKTQEIRACRNCIEEEEKNPVCDNMNQSHASICALSRYNCFQRLDHKPERVLVHIGYCTTRSPIFTLKEEICPKKCGIDRKPVCDEAGVTHRNLCSFQRSNCLARQAGRQAPMLNHVEACRENDKLIELKTDATVDINVSDNDNSTIDLSDKYKEHPPETNLEGSGVAPSIPRFECPLPTCTDDNSSPVCDSQGKYHDNICMFTYARCVSAQKGTFLTIDQDEKCLSAKCSEICDNSTRQICGSDLSTYQNECLFFKEKCKDPSLELLFHGSCSECLPSPCPPLSQSAPDSAFVCDSEDVTRSLCEYQMLSCIADKTPALNFTIIHLGKCCGSSEVCRNKSEAMLCGKDGRTYRNQCELDLENCRNEKLMVPGTEIDYKGECKLPEIIEEEGTFQVQEGFNFKEENATLCDENCNNLYSPVCGNNEVTYTNFCYLKLSNCKTQMNTSVAYNGECCDLKCPSNFDPVCDNENNSHQNLCTFGQQRCLAEKAFGKNLTISKFEVCTNDCSMICTKEYNPICGTNGITYVNMCEMQKQNCYIEKNITTGDPIVKDYEEECCPEFNCGFEFAPVCDSEGNTHSNDCIFRQAQCIQSRRGYANLTLQYKGACCNQPCENDYTPVCDGNTTHENVCRFRIAQCEAERMGLTMSLAYSGECCVQHTGICKASGTICDSYGQTHGNLCHFEYKKCLLDRTAKKTLTVAHRGECCSIEPCHKGNSPVCDSKGGTHASLCHFQNTQCIHNKIHPHSTIHFAYNGTCCSSSCGNEWEPVCDQHGAIYKNKCWFTRKACEQSRRLKVSLLLETPCTERRIRSLTRNRN